MTAVYPAVESDMDTESNHDCVDDPLDVISYASDREGPQIERQQNNGQNILMMWLKPSTITTYIETKNQTSRFRLESDPNASPSTHRFARHHSSSKAVNDSRYRAHENRGSLTYTNHIDCVNPADWPQRPRFTSEENETIETRSHTILSDLVVSHASNNCGGGKSCLRYRGITRPRSQVVDAGVQFDERTHCDTQRGHH